MSALREKLAQQIFQSWPGVMPCDCIKDEPTLVQEHLQELADAVLATLTTEASEGNLPPELLAAVDQGREVAAARRLAMGDAK